MISHRLIVVLAKKGRIEVIRALKAFPESDFSINELARSSKVATMTAWRAVKELKQAGFVRTRKVGNAISVRLTDDREKLRLLRLIPETDPQRAAAEQFSRTLAANDWLVECRLFGSIGRGEHALGDEVDVAVVYDDSVISEADAKESVATASADIRNDTNISIAPLLVAKRDMTKKGGLASELRDKEVIWSR
jgi:DNA-binding IscR family transcriptional regulator